VSEEPQTSAQLPPSSEIQSYSLTATTENWFAYPVRAHPNHTDYSELFGMALTLLGWKRRGLNAYAQSVSILLT
jgi:acyl-CoA thioester hydrolase